MFIICKAAILRLWQETTSQSRMHFYESNIFFSLKCTPHNGHISMVLLPLLQVGKTEEEKDFFYKFKTIWSILLILSVKMGRWLTLN